MHTCSSEAEAILCKQLTKAKWEKKTAARKCCSTYQFNRRANSRQWWGNRFICNSNRT